MKVELTIADDRELRSAIRDMIKGEVMSIARGEIRSILAEVMDEKLIPRNQDELKSIILKAIQDHVKKTIADAPYGQDTFIQRETRMIIREVLKKSISEGRSV